MGSGESTLTGAETPGSGANLGRGAGSWPESQVKAMFSNAVVGIDGQQGGRDAVALARALGAPDGAVTLAHVYGIGLILHGGWHHLFSAQREGSLELLERERGAAVLDATVVAFADRSVGRGLHRLAERQSADVLVIGSCRRSLLGRVFLGHDTLAALNGGSLRTGRMRPSG
jgi:nucleotide-binding universal stress UspA family protein